jgi:hypothetical protein
VIVEVLHAGSPAGIGLRSSSIVIRTPSCSTVAVRAGSSGTEIGVGLDVVGGCLTMWLAEAGAAEADDGSGAEMDGRGKTALHPRTTVPTRTRVELERTMRVNCTGVTPANRSKSDADGEGYVPGDRVHVRAVAFGTYPAPI